MWLKISEQSRVYRSQTHDAFPNQMQELWSMCTGTLQIVHCCAEELAISVVAFKLALGNSSCQEVAYYQEFLGSDDLDTWSPHAMSRVLENGKSLLLYLLDRRYFFGSLVHHRYYCQTQMIKRSERKFCQWYAHPLNFAKSKCHFCCRHLSYFQSGKLTGTIMRFEISFQVLFSTN